MDVLTGNDDRLLYELEQFLIKNNASDYLHYFLRTIYSRITSGEIVIIVAPIDIALARLVYRSEKSLGQIANLNEGRNMLENFLSSTHFQLGEPPIYKAVNGAYLARQENLDRLDYTAHTNIGTLFIETVNGIINMPGQLERLKQANPSNTIISSRSGIIGDNLVTNFDDFPNPIVRKIALNLSLPNIINSCRINSRFNTMICNNENFWNEKTRRDFPRQQEKQFQVSRTWKNTYRTLSKHLYVIGYLFESEEQDRDPNPNIDPNSNINPNTIRRINAPDYITYVAAGETHIAIIASGRLYTFGKGKNGRLGHDNLQNQLNPKLVEESNNGEILDDVTMVACGRAHTAVISKGQLYTFGSNEYGQLGHGKDKEREEKEREDDEEYQGGQLRPKLVEELDNVTFVACGTYYTAVISNGQLYTFGYNKYGVLGHGSEEGLDEDEQGEHQFTPKLVQGLDDVTFVACGILHTAAISNGQLYTFGVGQRGALGHGDDQTQFTPKLVEGLDNVTFVECGHSMTAAISDKQLYTFGEGLYGELGQDNRIEYLPVKIEPFEDPENPQVPSLYLDDVTMVACGSEYVTGVISNGRLYTLGDSSLQDVTNRHDNLRPDQYRPRLVEALHNVTFVSKSYGILVLAE